MGKDKDIQSVSNSLSTVVLHKIMIQYTNKSESILHLQKEEKEYRGQTLKKIYKKSWSQNEKNKIREKVIIRTKNRLKNKYPDVSVTDSIIISYVDEEINSAFR